MAQTKDLGTYKGLPIDSVGVEIPSMAGGLRDAVRVSDVVFERDVPHYIVLKVVPEKFKENPTFALDGSGRQTSQQKGWQEVAVMRLEGVAFIAEEAAQEAIAETAKLIEAQRIADEEARGVSRIPYDTESGEGSIASDVAKAVKKRAAKKPAAASNVKDIATRGKGDGAGK